MMLSTQGVHEVVIEEVNKIHGIVLDNYRVKIHKMENVSNKGISNNLLKHLRERAIDKMGVAFGYR